jgi:hypothetical protein
MRQTSVMLLFSVLKQQQQQQQIQVDYVSIVSGEGNLQLDEHFQQDVLPYLACCALSDNCAKYSALRPASLQYESFENVTNACVKMETVFKWAPYHTYPPPYHPLSTYSTDWEKLKVREGCLCPFLKLFCLTFLLAQCIVQDTI